MKRFLAWFGGIALVFIVIAAAGFAYLAHRGAALDRESHAYADDAVAAITATWTTQDLLARAAPELTAKATPDQLASLFTALRRLGPRTTAASCQGQSNMMLNTGQGAVVSANYVCTATFKAGPATISLILVKRARAWRIVGFHVDSPVFLRPAL